MKRALFASLILAASCLIGPAVTNGHVKYKNDGWAFWGTTRDSAQPGKEHKLDPITFIFRGGPATYTRAAIEQHLQSDWNYVEGLFPGGGIYGAPMTPNTGTTCTATENQGVMFADNKGHKDYDPDVDLNYHAELARYCGVQWHTRLWDDVEHDQMVPPDDHNVNSWWIGSIHFERRTDNLNHKRIRYSFERAAQRVFAPVFADNHCVIPKWKFLPGSVGKTGGKLDYSDGYLSRINLNRGPHQGFDYHKPCIANPGD